MKRFDPPIELGVSRVRPNGDSQLPHVKPNRSWMYAQNVIAGRLNYTPSKGDVRDFWSLSKGEKLPHIQKMLYSLYFTENANDQMKFNSVINNERNTMDLLAILELGKSLMCCCRLHYSFRDQPVVKDQRVLNRYIKFSSCSGHMDESLAAKKTITLEQLG